MNNTITNGFKYQDSNRGGEGKAIPEADGGRGAIRIGIDPTKATDVCHPRSADNDVTISTVGKLGRERAMLRVQMMHLGVKA